MILPLKIILTLAASLLAIIVWCAWYWLYDHKLCYWFRIDTFASMTFGVLWLGSGLLIAASIPTFTAWVVFS